MEQNTLTIKLIRYYQVIIFERTSPGINTYHMSGYTPITTNGTLALEAYASIRNPASQLIKANSLGELTDKRNKIIANMADPFWVEENIEPYL